MRYFDARPSALLWNSVSWTVTGNRVEGEAGLDLALRAPVEEDDVVMRLSLRKP